MSSNAGAIPWMAVSPQAADFPQAVAVAAAPQLVVAPMVVALCSSGGSSTWLGEKHSYLHSCSSLDVGGLIMRLLLL